MHFIRSWGLREPVGCSESPFRVYAMVEVARERWDEMYFNCTQFSHHLSVLYSVVNLLGACETVIEVYAHQSRGSSKLISVSYLRSLRSHT